MSVNNIEDAENYTAPDYEPLTDPESYDSQALQFLKLLAEYRAAKEAGTSSAELATVRARLQVLGGLL